MRISLPIESYRRLGNTARLVNMQAEQMPPEAKSPVSLMGTPGVRVFSTPTTGRGRGLHARGNKLYSLSGTSYSEINTNTGVTTVIGTIPGSDRAFFSTNTTQSVIVANGIAYVEVAGVLTAITDPDLLIRRVGPCGFADNYILFIDIGSQEFIGSSLGDATSYDALDFASAEGAPDNLVGIIVDHRQPILFGSESTEIWYDDGGDGFPFARSPGGFIELGCLAPRSIVQADNSVYWLANDLTVRRLSGDTPVRVSHHGVEAAIKGYTNAMDAEALSYTHEGHICCAFNFIHDNASWVYDVTTQEWHERDSFPAHVWRAVDCVTLNSVTYVQDRNTGAVGILDSACATEWGDPIRREWTYAEVYKENDRLFHSDFEVMMKMGVGNSSGSNPRIKLEYSDDGGPWLSAGQQTIGRWGRNTNRVYTTRLGAARRRVYRNIISDPVTVNVYDTTLEIQRGTG